MDEEPQSLIVDANAYAIELVDSGQMHEVGLHL